MKIPLLLFPFLASAGVSAFAAGEFRLPIRAGLFDTPGYRGGDWPDILTESGWLGGSSGVNETTAAWVANPADGISRRVGLPPEEGTGEGRYSGIKGITESGWVYGETRRINTSGKVEGYPWMADGATGRTMRGGLTGPEFGDEGNPPRSDFIQVTESGFARGYTARWRGLETVWSAEWIMNGRTGAVFRPGLFPGPPEDIVKYETSTANITESGWLCGWTSGPRGSSAWVMRADTGVTRRIGLFNPDSETDGSNVLEMTEDGLVAGVTQRRFQEGFYGSAAWVADAATGTVRRIGLYGEPIYRFFSDGLTFEGAELRLMTKKSGWITGRSVVYHGEQGASGHAAWVTDARAGTTRRVGLWEGEEFDRPAGFSGVAESEVSHLTESGWIAGSSTRYGVPDGDSVPRLGEAAWVARAATGETRRVGLTGGEFRHAGHESGMVDGVTESGQAWGRTVNHGDGKGGTAAEENGSAPWVADAATGETRRMALPGAEYVSSAGKVGGYVYPLYETGLFAGATTRWRGAEENGYAAWVADAVTGRITRVGLFDAEFTRAEDGRQETSVTDVTRSGFLAGVSTRQRPGQAPEQVPWVADARTGVTRRADSVPGRSTSILYLTESGLAAGETQRYDPQGPARWVLDIRTGERLDFYVTPVPPDGFLHAELKGVTPGGIVYGSGYLYRSGSSVSLRGFLWSPGMGTLVSEEILPEEGPWNGHGHVYEVALANDGGYVAGRGSLGVQYPAGVFFGKLSGLLGSAAGLRVTDLTRLPDGKWRLSFSTDAAVRITLQSSTDLTTWRDAQTMDAPAGASHMEIEPDPAAAPNHYWRLKTAPAAS